MLRGVVKKKKKKVKLIKPTRLNQEEGQWGHDFAPEDIWQCLETFWIVTEIGEGGAAGIRDEGQTCC